MGEIVNLNQARKARDRTVAKANAAENRVVHGRTKAERAGTRTDRERAARLLDGAKRED